MSEGRQNLSYVFFESARRHPSKEALVLDSGSLTYQELLDRVEALRSGMGSVQEEYVGILAHRSATAYSAVLAILAEGHAYVPMNPGFPPARNGYIVEKAALRTWIVGEECAPTLKGLLSQGAVPRRIVMLRESQAIRDIVAESGMPIEIVVSLPQPGSDPRPQAIIRPDSLAYALFTSGSTGVPKGVMVTHANVVSYIRSVLQLYPIFPEDRVSQTYDITFDPSVHDQFTTWAVGATLVSYPERALMSPLEWTAQQNVTVWFSVPSLAAFLESARQVVPGALDKIRLSMFCAEKLTWKTCQIWKTVAPNTRIANLYGPTEATITILHAEVPEGLPEEATFRGGIAIGKLFPGQKGEVRRDDGSICDVGEMGELWLAGDQVAPGYLGDPEKTAERFIERDGEIWYRTGDMVFVDRFGEIQYDGRVDFQVKVMGYRIELGEIEHALLKATDAAFAIADVAPIRGEMDELYGVLPKKFATLKKETKTFLKTKLPSYMVPRKIFYTDDIPLNANGKMDRGEIKRRVVEGLYST